MRGDIPLSEVDRKLAGTKGVNRVTAISLGSVGTGPKDPDNELETAVGNCAQLRELARLTSCRDGDIFRIVGDEYGSETKKLTTAGRTLYFDPSYSGTPHHGGLEGALRREDGGTARGPDRL